MGEEFKFSRDHKVVGLSDYQSRQMRGHAELGFEANSEFYLRLPDKKYLHIVLFCLLATEDKLSKTAKKMLSSLDQGFRAEIVQLYLSTNEKRKSFNGPADLGILSQTLKYNAKLIDACADKFTKKVVVHSVDQYKLSQKIMVKYSQGVHFGEYQKAEDVQGEALILKEDGNGKSIIVGAFSANSQEEVRKHKGAKSEEEEKVTEKAKQKVAEKQNRSAGEAKKRKGEAKKAEEASHTRESQEEKDSSEQWETERGRIQFTAVLVAIIIVLMLVALRSDFSQAIVRLCINMPSFSIAQRIESMFGSIQTLLP